jgi:lipopolysaccharide transport protein LptA
VFFIGGHESVFADLDNDIEVIDPAQGKKPVLDSIPETNAPDKIDERGVSPDQEKPILPTAPGTKLTPGSSVKDKGVSSKGAAPGAVQPADKKGKGGSKRSADENSKLPVTFESQGLRGTRKAGLLELQKEVIIKQGDFRMDADQAEVIMDQKTEEVDHVVANGNVKMTKVDPETGEKVKASADTVTFNAGKQTVTLSGNAKFSRGHDLVRGKTITYDLKSGWLNADKVEGVVQPSPENKVKP